MYDSSESESSFLAVPKQVQTRQTITSCTKSSVELENHQARSRNLENCASSEVDRTLWLKKSRKWITKSRSIRIQQEFKSLKVIISLNSSLVTMIYRLCCPILKILSTTLEPNIFTTSMQKNRLSEVNQPIETLAERQHIQECLPIFHDAPCSFRMNTTFNSPGECGSTHSTLNFLTSSPDSGIPQSSRYTPIPFQGESPAITSQPTTPSPLARNYSSNNIPSLALPLLTLKKHRNVTKHSSRVVREALLLKTFLI